MLLIECPRYLFPFARKIIADVTADGGYPPFMLDPIDFAGVLHAARKTEGAGTARQSATPEIPLPLASPGGRGGHLQPELHQRSSLFTTSRMKLACVARSASVERGASGLGRAP